MSKSPSASPTLSIREFFKRFPDDEACLVHIFNVRHGERHVCRACGKEATFHRMTNRRAWACSNCGDHLYPTAGTIFADTRTPLQMWFYAIYLFCTSRHGVSGKELQRQLGVTYKTAWRIAKHIRVLMESAEAEVLLSGHVEIDEAYVGGKRSGGKRGRGAPGKTIVMGLKERDGKMVATVIPDVKLKTLNAETIKRVEKGATVSTDELMSYGLLEKEGYTHVAVKHGAKEGSVYDYKTREVHHTTDEIDKRFRGFRATLSLRRLPRGEARRIGCKRRRAAHACPAGLRRLRTLNDDGEAARGASGAAQRAAGGSGARGVLGEHRRARRFWLLS